MKVFLDTNIFIEYTTCRKQFRWVRDVFDAIEDEIISAVASVGGMYTNAYLVTLYCKEHCIHRPEQTERVRQTLLAFLQLAPTVDCSAENLLQFAKLGSMYFEYFFQTKNPRISLLNIGEESAKGRPCGDSEKCGTFLCRFWL